MGEFVNTFGSGQHLDNDPRMQPKDTFRESLNGEITGVEGSNFTWKPISGTAMHVDIGESKIIGFINGIDRLYIISVSEYENVNQPDVIFNEIGYIEKTDNETGTYVPIYIAPLEFQFDPNYKIRGFFNYETATIQRLYMSNNYSEPKVLNVAALSFYDHTDQMEDGKDYIVIRGAISFHDGPVDYTDYFIGDVFTFNRSILLGPTIDFKACENIPYQLLPFNPDIANGSITDIEVIDGNLTVGTYYVTYRLVTEGFKTPFHSFSQPITLNLNDGYREDDTFLDFIYNNVTVNGGFEGESSKKGIKVRIEIDNDHYDSIEVVIFKENKSGILDNGYVYAKPLIQKEEVNSKVIYYIETEILQEEVGEVNSEEYLINPSVITRLKDITTIKNTSTALNVDELPELNIGQQISGEILVGIKEIPSDSITSVPEMIIPDYVNGSLGYMPRLKDDIESSPSGNELFAGIPGITSEGKISKIMPEQWYIVNEGSVGYYGNSYGIGNVFKGVVDEFNYSGTGIIEAVYPVVKYFNNVTGKHEVEHKRSGLELGYKGHQAEFLKSYWGDETYRIGVLPISKKGTPHYVRWIQDVKIPKRNHNIYAKQIKIDLKNDYYNQNANLVSEYNYSDMAAADLDEYSKRLWSSKILHLIIKQIDLTDIIDDISGFAIVRSPRDKNIKYEGIGEFTNIQQKSYKVKQIVADQSLTEERYKSIVRSNYYNKPEGRYGKENTGYGNEDSLGVTDNQDNNYIYLVSPDNIIDYESFHAGENDVLKRCRTYERSVLENNSKVLDLLTDDYFDDVYNNVPYDTSITTKLIRGEKYYREDQAFNDAYIKEFPVKKSYESKYLTQNTILESGSESYILDHSNTTLPQANITRFYRSTQEGDNYSESNYRNSFDMSQFCSPGELIYSNKAYDLFGYTIATNKIEVLSVVNNRQVLYGGTAPDALAKTKYIFTGHYQKVDADFKAAIKEGDKYIVRDIEVFGGDCYIAPFILTRSYFFNTRFPIIGKPANTEDPLYPFRSMFDGHIISVFLQTNINPLAKSGYRSNMNTFYYNEYFKPDAFDTWYRHDDEEEIKEYKSDDRWQHQINPLDEINKRLLSPVNTKVYSELSGENWDYEKAFGDTIREYSFFGLPENFKNEHDIPERLRYSLPKMNSEHIDNFRKFLPSNYVDLPGVYGTGTNVRRNGDYLVTWQQKAISVIPVSERALEANEFGMPIQLGVGSKFERVDDISKFYGNSHYFGLIEIPQGFIWYDDLKKAYIHMSKSEGMREEGIIKGMDSFFNSLPSFQEEQNIVSGYDPKKEMIFMSFVPLSKTIGYNTILGKFTDSYSFIPNNCVTFNDKMISNSSSNNSKVYIHSWLGSTKFYTQEMDTMLKVIIGSGIGTTKIFLRAIAVGEGDFFTKVKYETNYNPVTGLFENYHTDEGIDILSNYDRIPGQWQWGFPDSGPLGRFEDGYLIVTFEGTAALKTRITNIISLFNT